MQFHKHELENGLQIVAECNSDAHSIAVAFCVNTGARCAAGARILPAIDV